MNNRIDDSVPLATRDGVPLFLIHAFARLEQMNGYETEGIFRVEGNSKRLKDSVEVFCGAQPIPPGWNVFDVCTMIKRFFRRIETPIFNDCQPTLIKLAETLKENRATLSSAIFAVLDRLPPPHLATLGFLMRKLKKVSMHSGRNKMTVENLAIVFALALFRDEQVVTPAYQTPSWKARRSEISLLAITRVRTECQIGIVRLLIKHANLIGFPNRASIAERNFNSSSERPSNASSERLVNSPPPELPRALPTKLSLALPPKLPLALPPPGASPSLRSITFHSLNSEDTASTFSNRPSVASFLAENKGFVQMRRQFFDKR